MSEAAVSLVSSSSVSALCDRLRVAASDASPDPASLDVLLREFLTARMSVELLATTKVGLLVHSLKERFPSLSNIAKELIFRWKALAKENGIVSNKKNTVEVANNTNGKKEISPVKKAENSNSAAVKKPAVATNGNAAAVKKIVNNTAGVKTPANGAVKPKQLGDAESRKRKADSEPSSTAKKPAGATNSSTPRLPPSLPKGEEIIGSSNISLQAVGTPAESPSIVYYNPNVHLYEYKSKIVDEGENREEKQKISSPIENTGDSIMGSLDEEENDPVARKNTLIPDFTELARNSSGPSGEPVNLCSLKQMCVDYIQYHLHQVHQFPALPAKLVPTLFAKATVAQLRELEGFNSALKADSDILWRALIQRHYPDHKIPQSLQPGDSWRSQYSRLESAKQEKIAQLGERLKARQIQAASSKRENSVKQIDLKSANKTLIKTGKIPKIIPGSFPGSSAQPLRPPIAGGLAALRKDSKQIVNSLYQRKF